MTELSTGKRGQNDIVKMGYQKLLLYFDDWVAWTAFAVKHLNDEKHCYTLKSRPPKGVLLEHIKNIRNKDGPPIGI